MPKTVDDSSYLTSKDKRLGLLLWFRLSRFFNQSIRRSNQHLKEWELSASQFDILVQVKTHKRLTQKKLGEKMLVTKGNITQSITKLEHRGLVQRERDRKTKYLSLTEKGQRLYEEVVPEQEQFQASQFSNLTREEQVQLLELLKKLGPLK
ncbi:MarR family winged helix-turn-helix transcriptional regulator [Salibacterium lacus]|uniref:MarR family winged helix-turn-helix transcriptional regulator n=1 Tax=Salibacterium lacus TaxID=1898109 RepID=A0ABW5T5E8_9BACI